MTERSENERIKNKEATLSKAQRAAALSAALDDVPYREKSQTEYAHDAYIKLLKKLGRTNEQIAEELASGSLRSKLILAEMARLYAEDEQAAAEAKERAREPMKNLEVLL